MGRTLRSGRRLPLPCGPVASHQCAGFGPAHRLRHGRVSDLRVDRARRGGAGGVGLLPGSHQCPRLLPLPRLPLDAVRERGLPRRGGCRCQHQWSGTGGQPGGRSTPGQSGEALGNRPEWGRAQDLLPTGAGPVPTPLQRARHGTGDQQLDLLAGSRGGHREGHLSRFRRPADHQLSQLETRAGPGLVAGTAGGRPTGWGFGRRGWIGVLHGGVAGSRDLEPPVAAQWGGAGGFRLGLGRPVDVPEDLPRFVSRGR